MAVSKKKLYDRYITKVKPLLSTAQMEAIAESFATGRTEVLRVSRFESSAFDTSWVDVVEGILFDLGEIIKAPRTITKENGSLTPVELAKKTNSESVQHLASHTQYVKNIDEDGNVIPSKVMSFSNDDFLFTYENRFIATLIRRLVLFVEKRYAFVQEYLPLHREEVMLVKTKAVIDGEEVEIETRVKSKSVSEDPSAAQAEAVAERIRSMREYLLFYYASPFMKKMKNERDVRKPILMTNILRKNVRYHKCYEVFMFIERYESLGINYKSQDVYSGLSDAQIREFALLQAGQYLALQDERSFDTIHVKPHAYKPKMRTSIDEEEFLFGPMVKGPVEYVRVDEEFRRYLENITNPELPLHPRRSERVYFAPEYQLRKDVKDAGHQLDRLLSRKQQAAKRFEKTVLALIAKRLEEEALLAQMEEDERIEGEERLLNQKRAEIESLALAEELPIEEEQIPAEEPEIAEEPEQNPEIPAEEPVFEETQGPTEEPAIEEEPVLAQESEQQPAPEEVQPLEEGEQESAPEQTQGPVAEEEPVVAEEGEQQPAPEEPEPVLEPKAKKKPAPKKKAAPKRKSSPKKPEPKPEDLGDRFIVKGEDGYFVSRTKHTKKKTEAHVFTSFEEALSIKRQYGGKVVKL